MDVAKKMWNAVESAFYSMSDLERIAAVRVAIARSSDDFIRGMWRATPDDARREIILLHVMAQKDPEISSKGNVGKEPPKEPPKVAVSVDINPRPQANLAPAFAKHHNGVGNAIEKLIASGKPFTAKDLSPYTGRTVTDAIYRFAKIGKIRFVSQDDASLPSGERRYISASVQKEVRQPAVRPSAAGAKSRHLAGWNLSNEEILRLVQKYLDGVTSDYDKMSPSLMAHLRKFMTREGIESGQSRTTFLRAMLRWTQYGFLSRRESSSGVYIYSNARKES